MVLPVRRNSKNVGTSGVLEIYVHQISRNGKNLTSEVFVQGTIKNTNGPASAGGVQRSISGSGSVVDDPFYFSLSKGQSRIFLSHTFTLQHGDNGNHADVTYTIHYGVTGTDAFGDNQQISATISPARVPVPPSTPGRPTFTDVTNSTMTVSWDASSDDGGSNISDYILTTAGIAGPGGNAGPQVPPSHGKGTTRNLRGLDPGATYQFEVIAQNGAEQFNGASEPSLPNTVTMRGGAWVRNGGSWVEAIPYVRHGGKWKKADPYVRTGGKWLNTH